MSDNNESETICCGLFGFKSLENSFDENTHDIIFINKLQKKATPPISFCCSRVDLSNKCFLLIKVCDEKNMSLILTYKEVDNKRILIDGKFLINNKKYKVLSFNTHKKLEIGDKSYNYTGLCFINSF